jgi:exopolysaccharide biosynthesis polyprenyl glycosylphosphotransferase
MTKALNLRKFLLFWGDISLLYLSLFITVSFNTAVFYFHLLPFSILYLLWLTIFYIFGLYDLNIFRTSSTFYSKTLGALVVSVVMGMIFFYLTPQFDITPKTNLILNAFIFGILFWGWRRLFYFLFSSKFQNKIAVIEEKPHSLAKEILNRPYLGYKLINLNVNEDLLPQIQKEKIETIVVPQNLYANTRLTKNLYQSLPARINFLDWARAYEMICEKIPISFVGQTWFLENLKEGEKELYDRIKRIFDVVLAGILLTAALPLGALIALAVKAEDGGPLFYSQKRIGKNRKPFTLFKFRSMKMGAEEETGPIWAKKEDPRTTKVGKFLRNIHFDELPQMINVLKGDISLVGPRPERPEFVEQLEKEIPHYHVRHLIRPGFTGWAQIKFRYGRTIMDSQEKFQYDLYYLKNRSPFLDLGILLKTFQLFFKKE